MTSFDKLQALNVALCKDTGAGKGHATTNEARERYFAELAKRADAFRVAIAAARADTQRMAHHKCARHHYIDGIAGALSRALAMQAKGA